MKPIAMFAITACLFISAAQAFDIEDEAFDVEEQAFDINDEADTNPIVLDSDEQPQQPAYGPDVYSDRFARPYTFRTGQGEQVHGPVKINGYGLGVHMDQFGRPVRATPWP